MKELASTGEKKEQPIEAKKRPSLERQTAFREKPPSLVAETAPQTP